LMKMIKIQIFTDTMLPKTRKGERKEFPKPVDSLSPLCQKHLGRCLIPFYQLENRFALPQTLSSICTHQAGGRDANLFRARLLQSDEKDSQS
jgi:hypothetical protein